MNPQEIIELHAQTVAANRGQVARRRIFICLIALVLSLMACCEAQRSADPHDPNHSEVLEHLGLQTTPP